MSENDEIKKPEPIVLDIDEGFKLEGFAPSEDRHNTIEIALPRLLIKTMATGEALDYWVGNTGGVIRFRNIALESINENTSLVSGGDGNTTWMKVTATYTATQATFIEAVRLSSTNATRTPATIWSAQTVDQELEDGQAYTINWTLHADI